MSPEPAAGSGFAGAFFLPHAASAVATTNRTIAILFILLVLCWFVSLLALASKENDGASARRASERRTSATYFAALPPAEPAALSDAEPPSAGAAEPLVSVAAGSAGGFFLPQAASAEAATNRTIAIFFICSSPLCWLVRLLGLPLGQQKRYWPAQGSAPLVGAGVDGVPLPEPWSGLVSVVPVLFVGVVFSFFLPPQAARSAADMNRATMSFTSDLL